MAVFILLMGVQHPPPLNDRTAGAFSLLELRRSKELAKAERRPWSGRDLRGMLERERAALDAAAEKTKRAKRTAARVANQRAAAPANVQGPSVVPAPAKGAPADVAMEIDGDDWGTPVLHYGRRS